MMWQNKSNQIHSRSNGLAEKNGEFCSFDLKLSHLTRRSEEEAKRGGPMVFGRGMAVLGLAIGLLAVTQVAPVRLTRAATFKEVVGQARTLKFLTQQVMDSSMPNTGRVKSLFEWIHQANAGTYASAGTTREG